MNIENKILRYIEQINPGNLGMREKIESVEITGTDFGESNKIYFLRINEKLFLLKINGVGGKDRDFFRKEFLKLRALEPYSIAPKAFVYDEVALDDQCMMLEMIPGRTVKPEDIPIYLEQITATLNRMISIPTEELKKNEGFTRDINSCFEYAIMFPRHAIKQLTQYAARFGQDETYSLVKRAASGALKYVEERASVFEDSEMGLIHTGLHAGNIVITLESKLRLIDWEHSGVGDRAFEISSLFRSNVLSEEQQREVYSRYQVKTEGFEERVGIYSEIFKIHEVLWHAIRYDKARKSEIYLDDDKTPEYYFKLLGTHISRLRDSRLAQ